MQLSVNSLDHFVTILMFQKVEKNFSFTFFSLADIYCSQVLCKETMINIFQSVSGATYEEADIECSSTEDKSQAKEAQNGIRMSMTIAYNLSKHIK